MYFFSQPQQLTSKQSSWINRATGKRKNMYFWFGGDGQSCVWWFTHFLCFFKFYFTWQEPCLLREWWPLSLFPASRAHTAAAYVAPPTTHNMCEDYWRWHNKYKTPYDRWTKKKKKKSRTFFREHISIRYLIQQHCSFGYTLPFIPVRACLEIILSFSYCCLYSHGMWPPPCAIVTVFLTVCLFAFMICIHRFVFLMDLLQNI